MLSCNTLLNAHTHTVECQWFAQRRRQRSRFATQAHRTSSFPIPSNLTLSHLIRSHLVVIRPIRTITLPHKTHITYIHILLALPRRCFAFLVSVKDTKVICRRCVIDACILQVTFCFKQRRAATTKKKLLHIKEISFSLFCCCCCCLIFISVVVD